MISCCGCNSKPIKGPTSLICNNKKCERSKVTGVPRYLTNISVYDKSEQAVFVILGEAGKELTQKHASELVANYFETHRFIVKVTEHNLSGKIQTITVTKILPPQTSNDALNTGGDDSGPSGGVGDSVGERIRKESECLGLEESKRAKSG
ncbi:unnamed protein product [Eruca vesicaria subsp. sativa]|uniref:Uncharacterized protein n=1 Tax=Eruca vesicaria subsp. sativa TaxID=29727 RepID=A0ABC8L7T4_ERUVS|nr:unnamed protein product [Eruca vesicaria subsp. sativa]